MRIAAIVLAATVLVGCGGSTKPARLSLSDGVRVSGAVLVLARNCVDQLTGTTQVNATQVYRAMQTLIDAYRANPKSIYQPGGRARTMREVLSDEASSLDSCDPQDAHDLDRALAAG